MKTFKSVRCLIAGLTAGVMLCSSVAILPGLTMEVEAATVCTVNTDKTYQMIRGFGGMNLPEWISQGAQTQ